MAISTISVKRSLVFLWILSICILALLESNGGILSLLNKDNPFVIRDSDSFPNADNYGAESNVEIDSCDGRYIYVHDLPSRFNEDIIKNCSRLIKWFDDMCPAVSNMGLGPPITYSYGVLQGSSWYVTNQFMLEVIFHNRMKQYKCLTNDSTLASAIFVPFYAGLDIGRYLWDFNTSVRDSSPNDLLNWLIAKPEWKYMNGKDHFLVAGRVTWDFRRQTDENSDWGNKLFVSPQSKNMTFLIIESCPWCSNRDIGIPYPTFFHPSNDLDVHNWQDKVKNEKRRYLYTFVGAPRPQIQDSIRNDIIKQCVESMENCEWFDCSSRDNNCDDPVQVMEVFQRSSFCLQPPGDSFTRRSTFDSILAGCIPVFFQPESAYTQYVWHLPSNYTKYSVFISEVDIKNGKAKIEEILRQISQAEVTKMRDEVLRLIPRIIYANPSGKLEKIDDAFDIAIKGVIRKVQKKTRTEMQKELFFR